MLQYYKLRQRQLHTAVNAFLNNTQKNRTTEFTWAVKQSLKPSVQHKSSIKTNVRLFEIFI